MGKAASGGQFRNLVGGLNTTTDCVIDMIDGARIQNAIDELGKGVTQAEFIKWINNGCRLNIILANAFTVGDIFRHCAEKGDRRLCLSDNIQNWFVKPFLKRVVQIRTDLGKLNQYKLPRNMNDTSIQEGAGNPGLMDLDTFCNLKYLLIDHPELGKQFLGFELSKKECYLFHVKLPDGSKVAVRLRWLGDEWYFGADEFGDDGWSEGRVFLSFATVEK